MKSATNMSSIRRISIRNLKQITHIPTYQYFTAFYRSNASVKPKENKNNTLNIAREAKEARIHEVLSPPPPSNKNGNILNILNALNKCTKNEDIMNILSISTADQLIFTKSISMITKINKNSENTDDSIKHILIIWDMMESNGFLHITQCNLLLKSLIALRGHNECKQKFEDMIKNGTIPDVFTLSMLLMLCLREKGDISEAIRYWEIIVNDFKVTPDAFCYSLFLEIAKKADDIETAKKHFEECGEFKLNPSICWEMMNVYEECRDIEGMIKLKKFMEQNKIWIGPRTNEITEKQAESLNDLEVMIPIDQNSSIDNNNFGWIQC